MSHIPEEFICPISYDIMVDPVICEDGVTYDRINIMKFNKNESPVTRRPINKKNLIPNRALKCMIDKYIEKESFNNNVLNVDEHMKSIMISNYTKNKSEYMEYLNNYCLEEERAMNRKKMYLEEILNSVNDSMPILEYCVRNEHNLLMNKQHKYSLNMESLKMVIENKFEDIRQFIEEDNLIIAWLKKYVLCDGNQKYVDYIFDTIMYNLDEIINGLKSQWDINKTDYLYFQLEYYNKFRQVDKPREYYYVNYEGSIFDHSEHFVLSSIHMKHWVGLWLEDLHVKIYMLGYNIIEKYKMDINIYDIGVNVLNLNLRIDIPLIESHRKYIIDSSIEKINNNFYYKMIDSDNIKKLVYIVENIIHVITKIKSDYP